MSVLSCLSVQRRSAKCTPRAFSEYTASVPRVNGSARFSGFLGSVFVRCASYTKRAKCFQALGYLSPPKCAQTRSYCVLAAEGVWTTLFVGLWPRPVIDSFLHRPRQMLFALVRRNFACSVYDFFLRLPRLWLYALVRRNLS